MTERELLRLHIEAVWNLILPPIDEETHELILAQSLPPWSLYIGSFAQEQVTILRPGILPEQRTRYLEDAQRTGDTWDQTARMRREVVFHYPLISSEHQAQASQRARILTAEDADLINAFEAESVPYFLNPSHAPCIGVIIAGRLVSIAHTSRQTPAAYELGINTLPQAQRQGYAKAATILWTALVQQKGLAPIYSAFAWNIASLKLAQAVGYDPRINSVYGPVPETDE